MSKREKIKKEEENSKTNDEDIPDNEGKEAASKRKEALIVEEEIEKEMKERIKKREEKEKLYEGNRFRRFLRVHKNDINLMVYGFFLFVLLMMGILTAILLYVFMGVSTQEILLIACTSITIIGAVLLIFISRKYLLK